MYAWLHLAIFSSHTAFHFSHIELSWLRNAAGRSILLPNGQAGFFLSFFPPHLICVFQSFISNQAGGLLWNMQNGPGASPSSSPPSLIPPVQLIPPGRGRGEGRIARLLVSTSLSGSTGCPPVPWLTPSVNSHQPHWQLSVSCPCRVVTGRNTDRHPPPLVSQPRCNAKQS